MEAAIYEKIILTIVGIVVTGVITWLGTRLSKYKKLAEEQETTVLKDTIKDVVSEEIQPIKESIETINNDISTMKTDISNLQKFETNFSTRLKPTQDEIEHLKDDITEILDTLKQQGLDLQNISEKEAHLEKETRCAWRYRIRQLCHAYIARGYMSYDEYLQLQEMYNIYAAIGGNGQTKELYEKTIELEIKSDNEIASIEALNRGKSCPMIHE